MPHTAHVTAIPLLLLASAALVTTGCNCNRSGDGAAGAGGGGGPPGEFGKFDAQVAEVRLLADGRKADLLKSFRYPDATGKPGEAPAGTAIDGASIPQVFWSLIGGPYEGKYRFAS